MLYMVVAGAAACVMDKIDAGAKYYIFFPIDLNPNLTANVCVCMCVCLMQFNYHFARCKQFYMTKEIFVVDLTCFP
jgi:hypothetical protein